ncbi:MAG: porin [Comamonadaceae bacterium]|nr:porin [Comamonadaceae bacterium]
MKKSLIALAVLAASGASFAQSNVTLYGKADIWFGSVKSETSGTNLGSSSLSQTRLDSSGVNTSRWGMKGSEDLGGGLKANFQLEQGFNVDTGTAGVTGQTFNRQSWVGVSGGFGEVQFGRVWSSYDDINSSAIDSFGANVAAKYNVWLGYQDRPSNAVKYASPTISGFSGSLTYGLGEDKTAKNDASHVMALGGQYAQGPLFVGLAYQEQTQTGGANSVFSALPGDAAKIFPALSTAFTGKTTYTTINGSYDLGVAKLIGAYNIAKQTIDATSTTSAGEFKAKEFDLGVEVPLSASLNLGGGYAQSNVQVNGVDAWKTSGFTGALTYTLSKRTFVYGALQQVKLESQVSNDVAKSTLFALGVNHSF